MPHVVCQCGSRFKFAETHIGKKAKCKKCGTILTLEDDEAPIAIADEPDWGKEIEQATQNAHSLAAPPTKIPPGGIPKVIIEKPEKPDTYARSFVKTLLFPTSLGNFFNFSGIWFGLFVGSLIPFVSLLVACWWMAYRFQVVSSGAAGDQDIPNFKVVTDWVEELIYPFFRWTASWIIVLLPALVYATVATSQGWLNVGPMGPTLSNGLGGAAAISSWGDTTHPIDRIWAFLLADHDFVYRDGRVFDHLPHRTHHPHDTENFPSLSDDRDHRLCCHGYELPDRRLVSGANHPRRGRELWLNV